MADIVISGIIEQTINVYRCEKLYIVKKDDCKFNIINRNSIMANDSNSHRIILHMEGSGDIYIDDGIDVIISNKSGSGNIFFSGKVPQIYGPVSGSGNIIPYQTHFEHQN